VSKLTNMKVDKAAREKAYAPSMVEDGPAYPWVLNISLDDEALEKLKLEALPEAGESMMLVAKVKVTNVSSTDSSEGGKRRSVSLQITDMCLEDAGEKVEAAGKLYQE